MAWDHGHRPLGFITQEMVDYALAWVRADYYPDHLAAKIPKVTLTEILEDEDNSLHTYGHWTDGVYMVHLVAYLYERVYDTVMTGDTPGHDRPIGYDPEEDADD